MAAEFMKNLIEYLKSEDVSYLADDTSAYSSDASFLTLGLPGIVIFPKTEDEVKKVVGYCSKNKIAITPRAKGSGTAGASLAVEGGVIVMTDALGVTDRFGKRLDILRVNIFDVKGAEISLDGLAGCRDGEIYARVGAGVTTEELDKFLAKYGWQTAVVPSSGWSTIGGNFSTDAGGNGTPKYGTYKNVISRLKIVVSSLNGADVKVVSDRSKIKALGGGQGLYGIITELDVRIVPKLAEKDTLSVVCSCRAKDIESLGGLVGNFMVEMEKVCSPTIAEFMMADRSIFDKDDPLRANKDIMDLFDYKEGEYKFITIYQGERGDLSKLNDVAKSMPDIEYKEISSSQFKVMLDLRKAATGKSPGRVALPGFEDIYVNDPRYLGKVLKAIYSITEGSLPGRPIGHQYTGGLVIHYRPQANPTKAEYAKAWQLTGELCNKICTDEYKTVKRREHGLGLEIYKFASPDEREKIKALKKEFDPAGIFQPHILTENPTITFVGDRFEALR